MSFAVSPFIQNSPLPSALAGIPLNPVRINAKFTNSRPIISEIVSEASYNAAKGITDSIINRPARQRSNRVSTKLYAKSSSSESNNGSGKSTSTKSSSGKPNYPGSLNRPKGNVSFASGINSGLLVDPSQSTTDHYTPLFIMNGSLFDDLTSRQSLISKFLSTDIYFLYTTAICKMRNLYVARDFSLDDFTGYFETLCEALQVYYQVDSIVVLFDHGNVFNPGIRHLRNFITPEIVSGHEQLQRVLESCAIPPNLVNFIGFMYQNFSIGTVMDSPIIRLGYKDTLYDATNDDNKLNYDYYCDLIGRLTKYSKVSANILLVRKEWSKKMPSSTDVILYEPQFLNFWHNSNISFCDDKGLGFSRFVSSLDENCYYGLFSESADGAIYASSSIQFNGLQNPGIWKSFVDFDPKWQNFQKSSLSYFDGENIIAVTKPNFRMSSHIYSCPFFNDNKNEWENFKCSTSECRIVQSSCVGQMKFSITKTMEKLFNPN